jgi:hypothetical protein
MKSNNSRNYCHSSAEVAGYSMCAGLCSVCKKSEFTDVRYPMLACTISKNGCSSLKILGEWVCQSFEILPQYKKNAERNMNDGRDWNCSIEQCYCHHPNISPPCSFCERVDCK